MESGSDDDCLKAALQHSQEAYQRQLEGVETVDWDLVVVTALDMSQAELFRGHVRQRLALGILPRIQGISSSSSSSSSSSFPFLKEGGYLFLADPDGVKVGCGGATLRLLYLLRLCYGPTVATARVLVVHAGGFSKRIPHHSVSGKSFAWLPHFISTPSTNPQPSTCTSSTSSFSTLLSLFELKLILLIAIPRSMTGGGLWLTAGDVLEFFDAGSSPLLPEEALSSTPSACCIAHPCPLATASRHGVFCPPADHRVKHLRPFLCQEYLHKASASLLASRARVHLEEHRSSSLLSEQVVEEALVDGNIFFNAAMAALLADIYEELTAGDSIPLAAEIDAFGDILRPLAATRDPAYIHAADNVSQPTDSLPLHRRTLLDRLEPFPLHVVPLLPSRFVHIGSLPEYLLHLCRTLPSSGLSGDPLCALHPSASLASPVSLLCSAVGPSVSIAALAAVEFSVLRRGSSVGSGCLVVDTDIPEAVAVPDSTLIYSLPLKNGLIAVLCLDASLSLKDPLSRLVSSSPCSISLPKHLLPSSELWNVPLLACHASPTQALLRALHLRQHPSDYLSAWPSLDPALASFNDCLHLADSSAAARRRALFLLFRSLRPLFSSQSPASTWSHPLLTFGLLDASSESEISEASQLLLPQDTSSQLQLSRLYASLGQLLDIPRFTGIAARLLRHCIANALSPPLGPSLLPLSSASAKHPVEIALPARLVLAGGWTDTPPYTLERPGRVLNCAVRVNGALPIRAFARPLPGHAVVRLCSDDQQGVQECVSWDPIVQPTPDHAADALTIHRACVHVLFRRQIELGHSLQQCLEEWMGADTGLELRTAVALPRGSGLGTSSILVWGCLAALMELLLPSRPWPLQDSVNNALLVEQLVGSAGGWQDQVGGASPGIKYTRSTPRHDSELLHYSFRHIPLSPDQLQCFNQRLVALYTGRQRVAHRVLSQVVAGWQTRHPQVVAALEGISRSASAMKASFLRLSAATNPQLLEEALADIGSGLDHIRALNVKLEPLRFIPPEIAPIFDHIRGSVYGSHLMGAGAGGYILAILKPHIVLDIFVASVSQAFPEVSLEHITLYQ